MSLIKSFPHILHGGDYNPDQWIHAPEVIDEDFRLMKLAGCNTFTIGVFAWAVLEPEEGRYDFVFFDSIMDRMAAEGHNVILATPSGARPFWLGDKYEEVRRVNRQGQREITQTRHNHCWTSPVYRQKVRALNTALASRYGGHPALKMWHVSNELHGECLCPLCLASFREWLQRKYPTLEALNLAWWSGFWAHRISDWSQINPRDFVMDGLALDWQRFVSWQWRDFYQWEAATLRERSPGIPVTTNLMGFFEGIDYHSVAPLLDVIADDNYPRYNSANPRLLRDVLETSLRFDMLRCLKGKPLPWFLMESCVDGRNGWSSIKLKDPGLHHLEMFQALAHGAEGTLYFQWRKGRGGCEKNHGSVLNHTHPEETRSFREVQALSQREQKLDGILGSLNHARVGLLLDWESRWAYRSSSGMPFPDTLIDHAAAQYLPFWRRGVTVDVLASHHDFSSYDLLLLPRLYLLKPGFADRLREYVNQGGIVVMTALTGMVNDTNLCWTDGCPGDGLEALAGVWLEEVDILENTETQQITAAPGNSLGLSGSWSTGTVCPTLKLRTATPLLHYSSGWKAGTPAATVNQSGQGCVYFLGADLNEDTADSLYSAIIRDLKLPTFLADQSPLPPGVTAQCRIKDRLPYWFLLNFSDSPRQITVPPHALDAETQQPTNALLTLSPWEARVLQIPD
ncbi:beta-galactosidase [soil metagenome]